jgi:phosphoserine aminotransferase
MDYHRSHERPVYNFSAGPCMLPRSILEQASSEMLTWDISANELSHRSREYAEIAEQCEESLRKLLNVPRDFELLFLPGGATAQFSGIPYNLTAGGGKEIPRQRAFYFTTGLWSSQAIKEASKICPVTEVWSQITPVFNRIPPLSEWNLTNLRT